MDKRRRVCFSNSSSSEEEIKANSKNKYLKQWELLPEFRGWLCQEEKESAASTSAVRAFCKVCKIAQVAKKSELQKHAKTQKHIRNASLLLTNKQPKMSSFLSKPSDVQVKEAEIKLCVFAAEHNIPFIAFDHLTALLKKIFTDSETAKNMTLCSTKATCIIRNVTGEFGLRKLISILKNQVFSIIIDESTTIDSKKNLVVICRYVVDLQKVKVFWL
ncbi:uncharacterized protein LOC129953478 isoform X2 [Eupeodes corollae]|uniref:uncharacterized protein LOC129953478 isoform X2 n=1 Tax=Eupeodes corollae TaxID=290404 RepID=UPI002492F109|nr:uncharacterized protein LOC129953478 isoform X2 [Eupeodes corollae]